MKTKLIAGALTLAALGATTGVVAAAGDPAPTVAVDVTADAIAFAGQPTVNADLNRLELRFKGAGERAVALVELKAGVTQEAFGTALGSIKDPTQVEKYGRIVASTFVTGATTYATTTELRDADYAFVDLTKRPAVRLGFHAGPGANATAVAPRRDATVKMLDYRFAGAATLRSGKRVVRVDNAGKHQHHALMMPLRPGVDTKKVLRDVRAGKEPRNVLAGPPSALVETVSPGTRNDVEVDLRKGRYLLVCFLQDNPRTKPHAMKGMERIVTVR